MESLKDIFIIPDIHGRDFWKSCVRKVAPDSRLIFLGDYLDPYPDDNINWDEAFEGFLEVISLKKDRPDSVTLLWGNHDLHYLFGGIEGSRKDYSRAALIRKSFEDNMECFQMACEAQLAGRKTLFTHAGVHRRWAYRHEDILGPLEKLNSEMLNSQMFSPEFVSTLSEISLWRGGWDPVGSMVWEDARAYRDETSPLPGYLQIFGHTQLSEDPSVFNGQMVCLDCKTVFVLSEEEDGSLMLRKAPFGLHPVRL